MEFYINKGATLPILKMELINDGRNDFHKFYEKIQNSNIYFTMTNLTTGVKIIAKSVASLELVEPESCTGEEYYITFQFNTKQTSVSGRYIGQFEIDFLDDSGTLIAPIKESLFINILDQGIKK